MTSPAKFIPRKIEPKILPLVKALNDTGLVKTFSSCQGHYRGTDQKLQDRNFADVRFYKLPNASEKELETLLVSVISDFWYQNSVVIIEAFKKFIPDPDKKNEPMYLITLAPLDRFDHPSKKRKDTDQAIKMATNLVLEATKQKKGKK